MHQKALEPERYARGTEETILYSAPVESFLATSSWNRVYGEATDAFRASGPEQPVSRPGGAGAGRSPARSRCGAAASGRRARRGRSRRSVAAAALVALGPRIRAFGADLGPGPWALLRDALPVFQMIRVTSRAGVFVALPLVMLAALALEKLRPGRAALALVALLALAETLIVPIPMPEWSKVIDTRREPPPVYRWLAEQPGRDAVVHLPMLDVYGLERRPAFHESVYMVYSTLHWKPLVNGYAGIEPRRYVELRELVRFVPVRRVARRPARGGRPLRDRARPRLGPQPVGAAAERMPAALGASLREVAVLGTDTVYELTPAR